MVSFLSCLSRKDLVRVEATVIEKTESWPKINMKFRKRKNFRKTKSKCETVSWGLCTQHTVAVPCFLTSGWAVPG